MMLSGGWLLAAALVLGSTAWGQEDPSYALRQAACAGDFARG